MTHSLLALPALGWLSSLYVLVSGSGLRRRTRETAQGGMVSPLMETDLGGSGNPEKGPPEPDGREGVLREAAVRTG